MENTIKTLGVAIVISTIIFVIYQSSVNRKEENFRNAQIRQLDTCLGEAEFEYWTYMELNGETDDKGIISARTSVWDNAEFKKENAIDNCYKRYALK